MWLTNQRHDKFEQPGPAIDEVNDVVGDGGDAHPGATMQVIMVNPSDKKQAVLAHRDDELPEGVAGTP